MNYVDAINTLVLADVRVRLEQVVQGADVMSLALRSNNTPGGEALARAVEAVRDAAILAELGHASA